jgi:toxin ParE1/3/4
LKPAGRFRPWAGAALAKAFLAQFERVALLLEQRPELGTPATGQRRIFPFRRFPYSIIYRAAPEGLRILVVGHQHRRPNYWRDRK